ncbi:MAG: histidinol-phosphate transaminase [Thermoleophilia bacterium]|nr:histidinol-phosphate transaminase [Thermoleophilia bacterium]
MEADSSLTNLARAALAGVAPYEPGRPIDDVRRELGIEHVIKLASNEGPYPPAPAALEAMAAAAADVRLYPDSGAWHLRDALSDHLAVPAEWILPGNGVDSLIKLLCLSVLDPGDDLAVCWPSFVSWRQGAAMMGAAIAEAELAPDGSFDLDRLREAIGPRTKLAVVVSPNNPTGAAVGRAALDDFLGTLPEHVLPVIDEAYFEYLPEGGHDAVRYAREGRSIVVMRTFSKAYALAGLRVGYMVAPPSLLGVVSRVRNAFDVNAIAQAAAIASLRDADGVLRERLDEVARERVRVAAGLVSQGLEVLPSTANFVLVRFASPAAAQAVNRALLHRGVIVRPAGPFGAPESLRITIGLPSENDELLAQMAGALVDAAASD